MIWEFALPRSVFTSAILGNKECVPYPPMSRACREALLVVKEFGSMVTAWNWIKDRRCWEILMRSETEEIPWPEDVPNETEMCIRTWFSSKLDTLVLNPKDCMIPYWGDDYYQHDFIDFIGIGLSPTTCLVVHNDLSSCGSEYLENLYDNYLKHRQEILLGIGDFKLVFKDKAWDIAARLNMSYSAGNQTQVIRLDDTAALAKCLKLWEHCCHFETPRSYLNRHHDFGEWLDMAIDKDKRGGGGRWQRTYMAWVVENRAYEERLVSPEAYFLLRVVDIVISRHESIWKTGRGREHRGHEVMDDTGRLKNDHPLVRELDIKLPRVIPVCTVSFHRQCRCEAGTARRGRVLRSAFSSEGMGLTA